MHKYKFSLPRLDITGMWVFSLGVWFHIVARLVYSKPWMAFLLATPTTFLVNVNTLEALPLLQGATDAAGFMARMDTVLQMYGGKKGAK
ncbi:hypothetical protein NXZ32_22410 [Escherichia coli]|nr:hypothetical protein [Escherichia coli]